MMAVPEPVRRGAGVVNCKSKPFDHIIICRKWGHLLPSDESQKTCFASFSVSLSSLSLKTSHCHPLSLTQTKIKTKGMCDIRGE